MKYHKKIVKSKDIYLLLRSDRPFKVILYFRQDLMQIKTVLLSSFKPLADIRIH